MRKLRLLINVIFQAFIYLIISLVIMVIIHETGHILIALLSGVSFSSIKLTIYGISPGVIFPESFTGISRTVADYTGGFLSGSIFLIIYISYWYRVFRFQSSFQNWLGGLITAALAGWQLSNGYLEGQYHVAYVLGANSLFAPTALFIYCFVAASLLLHLVLFPRRLIKPITI